MTIEETIQIMKNEADKLGKQVNEHLIILRNRKKFTCTQYQTVQNISYQIKRNPFIDNFYANICIKMLKISNM